MEEKLVVLSPGQVVNRKWTITKKLGAGAFGAVYLCRSNDGLMAALKTEPLDAQPPLLAMEAKVLQELHRLQDGRHFTKCHDLGRDTQPDEKGQPATFNYIVMALVGRGLDKLIEDRPNRKFSPGTAVGVSIQLIKALRALHGLGFLHRDIKPANSTIGRPEDGELRVVYLLDFGMARKFTREDGTLRRPRPGSNFRGSPRYAAISAHINREYSRKDDIESWFYQMVEMYKGVLPWGSIGDMNQIGEAKQKRLPDRPVEVRRQAVREIIDGCPMEFAAILKHIDNLKFYTRPDYKWIMQQLRDYLNNNNISEHPYDWEPGEHRPVAPPRGNAVNSYFN